MHFPSATSLTAAPLTARGTRRSKALTTAVALALGVGAFAVGTGSTVEAAGVLHVAPSGNDAGNGTAADPFRSVGRAVQVASGGDTVVIGAGVYHESVQVYAKEVHLTAAPDADVVFDGARSVAEWTPHDGAWFAPWSTNFERSGTPYTLPDRPEAGWPEQFWIDGVELTEARNRSDLGPASFYYDGASGQVWIGTDPTGRRVEGSDLNWAVYLNRADGSSLSDITVRRYATQRRNMAAVRAYANDLTLTDLVVEDNAYMGVSMIGADIDVDQLISRRNGHLGVHAHQSTNISVVDAVIEGNNAEGFDGHHSAGGLKVTNTTGLAVRDTRVVDNGGPGIWTDLATVDIDVTGNWVADNARSGIEIELSRRAVVANNTVINNGEAGVWVLESSDVDVWHNAVFENHRDVWVEEGPRAEVQRVDVVNNTLGGGSPGAPAILNVDDWTGERSAEQMNVSLAGNRYWLPADSPTPNVSRWANWPYPLALSATIEQHAAATLGDSDAQHSTAATNPYVRSPLDSRQQVGAPAGQPLARVVAGALGQPDGAAFASGPITAFGATATPTEPPASPNNTGSGTTTTTPTTTTSTPTTTTTATSTTTTTSTTTGPTSTTQPSTPSTAPTGSTSTPPTTGTTPIGTVQVVGSNGAVGAPILPTHGTAGERTLQPAERRSPVVFQAGLMGTARLIGSPTS